VGDFVALARECFADEHGHEILLGSSDSFLRGVGRFVPRAWGADPLRPRERTKHTCA
jgi:hypothetical protein